MPVLTPGPTTRRGARAHFEASSSHSRTRTGTDVARQIPPTESKSNSPLSRTPSSSAVVECSVVRRQWSRRSASSYRPSTVCVFPTSAASSIAQVNQRPRVGQAEALGARDQKGLAAQEARRSDRGGRVSDQASETTTQDERKRNKAVICRFVEE